MVQAKLAAARSMLSHSAVLAVSILFLGFHLASAQPAPENLTEMFARKARRAAAVWGPDQLEEANTFYWQAETFMYRDVTTGHEVWKLSNDPNSTDYFHNDITLNTWSANGRRMAFTSVRPTNAYNNYESWSNSYRRIWMMMSSDGSNLRTPVNTPRRLAGGDPLFWSPQIPVESM